MEKVSLEEIIRNVRILVRNEVPIPVILFALKGDGLSKERSETIIRWAKQSIENNKVVNLNTIIDVKEE